MPVDAGTQGRVGNQAEIAFEAELRTHMLAPSSRWTRLALICGAGLALWLPGSEVAAQTPRSGLSLALEQAWRLNPQAAALAAREAEAREMQTIAAGLTPEPGSVTVGSRNDRLGRNLGIQEYEVELTTPLWLPGQRAARINEAESHSDAVEARRASLRSELAGELREAWWVLAAARNARILAARRLDTARLLEANVKRRYTVGELSLIDANLAQTEVHAADADLIDAESALSQAEQAVLLLVGVAAPAELGEEALPSPDGPNARPGSPLEHPQIAAAATAARNARARVTVADQSRRAAPELTLRMVRERADFSEQLVNSVGIRLKIPFSSETHVRRESAAAQADADQADVEMQRTQARIQREIERARGALRSSERQLVLATERRRLSAENLRLSEKAFSLGESDLATVLAIRATAFDADAFLDRQRVARAAAISRLKQALGLLP